MTVREMAGMRVVYGAAKNVSDVTIREMADEIAITATYQDTRLTPAEARYLARQLNRLVRKIEARQETKPDAK
jgi:hypothetical protein